MNRTLDTKQGNAQGKQHQTTAEVNLKYLGLNTNIQFYCQ